MKNSIFYTNPPSISCQIGETKPVERWEASKKLAEREIVMDFFKKGIAILDKSQKELVAKYPRMLKK